MVEYAFLLAFVSAPTAFVLIKGGKAMYDSYTYQRTMILAPTP